MKDGSWEGKDLKIVNYGHHEIISPSKLPNIGFLFKFNYPIFTEELLNINQLPRKYGDKQIKSTPEIKLNLNGHAACFHHLHCIRHLYTVQYVSFNTRFETQR